jgi:hypothetical protein
MKHILIERKPQSPTHCESFMSLPGNGVLAGIERPYIDAPTPGGKPFESSVPVGVYETRPHTRPDGAEVIALINEELGVYYQQSDMPAAGGRYLILCHVANWAHQVNGCYAPGIWHADNPTGRMVSSSGKAMRRLMNYIDGDDCEIKIRNI